MLSVSYSFYEVGLSASKSDDLPVPKVAQLRQQRAELVFVSDLYRQTITSGEHWSIKLHRRSIGE